MTNTTQITTVTNMESVSQVVTQDLKNSSNVLIAFDVDMTLTIPDYLACQHHNLQKHEKIFKKTFSTI